MLGSFFLDKSDPGSLRALNGLVLKVTAAAVAAGLDRAVVEPLDVQVSQLNGCAYCLDLHDRLAREAGVGAQQLAVLPAWSEAAVFTSIERAPLATGEAATALHDDLNFAAEQFPSLLWGATTVAQS